VLVVQSATGGCGKLTQFRRLRRLAEYHGVRLAGIWGSSDVETN